MNYRDHEPPHFHAKYQEYEVIVQISNGEVTGSMSRRALNLIFEWLELHKDELMQNWQLARDHKALNKIAPLD